MNTPFPRVFTVVLCLLGLSLLGGTTAHASTSFSGLAMVTFTLNSITNLNPAHPEDLSGLEILGAFQQPGDAASFYLITTGDGSVSANNPDVPPAPISGGSFAGSFAVNGNASAGSVNSFHTGKYDLTFNATGSDSYSIDVGVSYQLTAGGAGLFAGSTVTLDWASVDGSFIGGSDAATAATFVGQSTDQHLSSGSDNWSFVLGPGASQKLFADATILGNLQAVAPVPVPAALWLFGSALGALGLGSRRRRA